MHKNTKLSTRSKRLSREDWLHHALDTLEHRGFEGLRVEPMARALNVTPGSFYWHFKDRGDLLDSVVELWVNRMIADVREHAEVATGTAEERLLTLMDMVTRLNLGRYETAMRGWAAADERVAAVVRQVDRARLEYVEGIFSEMGFDETEAGLRARMMIFYQMGEASFTLKDSDVEKVRRVRQRHRILTSAEVPVGH